MKEENRKYEYVIGIDLGHGETSAAICPLQWDTPVDQLDPVKDLEMGGNKKVIPSAITIIDDSTAYIGESAFNPDVLRKAEVHVCFKQAPKDINGEAEKIMVRFMSEVYKRIRANNAGILTDGNHLVYIATPSGWDSKTQQLYVKMAQKAGLPILNNGVTKESRAAFVRAQQDQVSGIGRNISKGAIVFDMGSSTLDFTYMNDALPNLIDNGYNCGASQVEKLIFADREEESAAVRLFEKKYPKLTDFLLFEARKVKEQVYFDPSLKVKKTINFEDFIDDEELEDERFKIAFQPGELDKMLGNKGYINSVAQAMLDYKRNHISGQKIYGVFLTGGASRMDFIKELVCKCWEVPEDKIYRDQDPSLTISQGVAEVARMDLRTEGMDEGLSDAINRLMNSDDIYNIFVNSFGAELADQIGTTVGNTINAFGTVSQDYSLNDLQASIEENIGKTISELSPQAPEYLQASIEEGLKDIQTKVEDIIKHYSKQGSTAVSVSYSVSLPQITDINLNSVMNDISERIASESSDWSGAITGAAIGGGIALLLGGPLFWLIGGAALLGKIFFGDSEEEKKAKAMAKDLSLEERAKVREQIFEKGQELQDKINESVENALMGDQEIKRNINSSVRKLLQTYQQNLKSARILID